MFDDGSDSPLLKLLPPIGRARDFRLYALNGKRLVDLWQYGGRALLGHTPVKLLLSFKNSASRGLFSPFPHPQHARLEKALTSLFPSRLARIYRDKDSLRAALTAAEKPLSDDAVLWRPFLDIKAPFVMPDVPAFIPVLPLPWMNPPLFLIIKHEASSLFPESDIISPVLLSASTRVVYELIRGEKSRAQLPFNKLDKKLSQLPWKRQGIYLWHTTKLTEDAYSQLFLHFLEGGFVLPPTSSLPAIIPPSMSDGETAKLFSLLSYKP